MWLSFELSPLSRGRVLVLLFPSLQGCKLPIFTVVPTAFFSANVPSTCFVLFASAGMSVSASSGLYTSVLSGYSAIVLSLRSGWTAECTSNCMAPRLSPQLRFVQLSCCILCSCPAKSTCLLLSILANFYLLSRFFLSNPCLSRRVATRARQCYSFLVRRPWAG